MAFTPERGALIVDSQYENEDQQFLEEIHLSKNNCIGTENGSVNSDHASSGFYSRDYSQQSGKTYTRLRTIKTEPMDYDEQTCSENGFSIFSFSIIFFTSPVSSMKRSLQIISLQLTFNQFSGLVTNFRFRDEN